MVSCVVSDCCMSSFKKATDRTVVLDLLSAWLFVGAKPDNSEFVCMEASLDVGGADHSRVRKDVVHQVEGNDDKVACIPEHGIAKSEVVHGMGVSAFVKSEKNSGYNNRVCSSRRWRKLVLDFDLGESQFLSDVHESSKSHVPVLCMTRDLQGEVPNPKKRSVGFGLKTIESR